MTFQLSANVDKNKIFLVNRSELEGRFDPFCYIPELVALDRKIKARTEKKLRDFVVFRASGATPSKSNDEYYSDSKNGIPFVRVQNLSTTGELDLADLVYIAEETHNGLLKRSQIRQYDLLIKITGVGRMAIASVVPDAFEGNINQHIVAVRTGSKEISENLAAFLNLDSVEKIATKRATGGTRPALDYPALFSIPVLNSRDIYLRIQKAVVAKKQKEAEAQQLLDSIDAYLLGELGIELPEEEEDTVEGRVFIRPFSEVSGKRFDPKSYSDFYSNLRKKISNSNYRCTPLSKLITSSQSGSWGLDEDTVDTNNLYTKCLVIRATEFDNDYNLNLLNERIKYRLISKSKLQILNIREGDLLLEKSGGSPNQPVGRIAIIKPTHLNREPICYSNFIHKFSIDKDQATPDYLFFYLKTIHSIGLTESMQSQTNGIRNLIMGEYFAQLIPLPSLERQNEIANQIAAIHNRTRQLQQEATAELIQAKQEVEQLILGEQSI